MRTWLLLYGQFLLSAIYLRLAEFQSQPVQREGIPAWAIALLAIGAVLLCLLLLPVCIIVILALMGPVIGNVFSNIILEV